MHACDSNASTHNIKTERVLGALEQSGRVQRSAERQVPLSIPEIRRLFWWLVLATKPTIGHMLEWSARLRWHQGMAQYYYDKRRAGPEVQL